MARDTLNVQFKLDLIRCYDEGDGWGNAEPYLWTVFFKIDGSGVYVSPAAKLVGQSTVYFTPGSHGNLGTTDVDAGDTVAIPDAIALWNTTLKPIPVCPPLNAFTPDIGGVIGVVCVLMEEDNVSDDGAEAGHQALNTGVQNALNEIIATISFEHPELTDDDINKYIDALQSRVESAVQDQQNFFENLWSWLNADDTIGTKVFRFKHDDLANQHNISFSQRWPNEGDWELFGHVSAAPSFRFALGKSIPIELIKSINSFREHDLKKYSGVQAWWDLTERLMPEYMWAMSSGEPMKSHLTSLLQKIPHVLGRRTEVIPGDFLDHLETVLEQLVAHGSRRARIDASRALTLLQHVRGRSVQQTLEILHAVPPARHPRLSGGPRLQAAGAVGRSNGDNSPTETGKEDGGNYQTAVSPKTA